MGHHPAGGLSDCEFRLTDLPVAGKKMVFLARFFYILSRRDGITGALTQSMRSSRASWTRRIFDSNLTIPGIDYAASTGCGLPCDFNWHWRYGCTQSALCQ
jgi:hypothetical protein